MCRCTRVPHNVSYVRLTENCIPMAAPEKLTTTVSTKGQVILPHSIRRKRHWNAGTKLTVVDTPEGVLLTSEPIFKPTRLEDVFGCAKYHGPPKTIEEMDAAIEAEVKARHARGRY